MGGLNVKNTIVERVLQMVAPHPCSGCGKVGYVLCDDCKYDIIHEPFAGCLLCGTPNLAGICPSHGISIEKAFCVGQRSDVLKDTIDRLKFQNVKAAARALALLLNEAVPLLPSSVAVVGLPTAPNHSRARGFDHIGLITRHFASLRNVDVIKPLRRVSKTTQRTANRSTRQLQALAAFAIDPTVDVSGRHILLIDDVVTTGASIAAAATALVNAGATVWVAVLAYQPLD